ncbi:MAG: hypothetical protein QM699_11405 [Amaricoccus sp.]|uniref:hypothetical protein n=1 Tax=Amaricoccus sp. TaxID=1872485 RepID=UPI0039E639F9
MTRLHIAFTLAACLVPGLALADMSCAEFNGMDMDSQMQIVGSMAEAGEGGMSASGTMTVDQGDDAEVMANDDLVMAVQAACKQSPERTLGAAVSDASDNE